MDDICYRGINDMIGNRLKMSYIVGIIIILVISSICPMISGTNAISHGEDFSQDLDNLLFYAGYDNPHITEAIIREKYFHYIQYFDGSQNSKEGVYLEETFSARLQYGVEKQSPQTSSRGPMDSPWSMFCHDTHHTGQSPYSTMHNTGTEKWRFDVEGLIEDTPVIDDDGNIYFGAFVDHYLYCLFPDGSLKWKYKADSYMWGSSPAIDEDGTIYVGSWDDYLYAINSNGTLKWRFCAYANIASSPVIAEDGTIYFGLMGPGYDKGRIYALNTNGTEKWHYDTGYWIVSNPAIGDDGTIYIGSGDGYLYALYTNGALRWRFQTGDEIHGHPSIADDGTIYIGSNDDYLYAIYPNNGTEKWRFNTEWGLYGNPSIANDGTIYVGTNKLYAVNPNGTMRWGFYLGLDRMIGRSSPAISSDGIIYTGTTIGSMSGGEIVSVNPNGTECWRKEIANDWVESSPSIGEDGTVYIGSSWHHSGAAAGILYAIGYSELEADAHGPYLGIIDQPVQFTGSADGGYPPYGYHWDFGDDETSDDQNPMHEYDTAGNYTVTLTITDDNDSVAVDTTWALIIEENNPPSAPTIIGETNGKFGESYDYTFVSTDPESHTVWYYIDWEDGDVEEWIGPYPSGKEVTVSHIWDDRGTYTIRAKARDLFEGESDWTYLEVKMPVNQQLTYPLFHRFLDRFPNAFPILRHLLEL